MFISKNVRRLLLSDGSPPHRVIYYESIAVNGFVNNDLKSHTYTNIDNMSITKDAGLVFIIGKDKPLIA